MKMHKLSYLLPIGFLGTGISAYHKWHFFVYFFEWLMLVGAFGLFFAVKKYYSK